MRKCPLCAEEIQDKAVKCKHCGSILVSDEWRVFCEGYLKMPAEWQQAVALLQTTDCLIIGRTEPAFRTHPQALQQTEKIVNTVFSQLLDQSVDLGGGSRGFSRRAGQTLIDQTSPGPWVDAEWPMILHRAGFGLDYLAVDGLDWESADRYRQQAADAATQRRIAEAYDQDADNWAIRVQFALDIVRAGLAALGS